MLFFKHAPYVVFKLAGLTGQNDRSLGFEPTYMVIVVEVLLYRRFIRDGSPGRPPRPSTQLLGSDKQAYMVLYGRFYTASFALFSALEQIHRALVACDFE